MMKVVDMGVVLRKVLEMLQILLPTPNVHWMIKDITWVYSVMYMPKLILRNTLRREPVLVELLIISTIIIMAIINMKTQKIMGQIVLVKMVDLIVAGHGPIL